MMTKSGDGKAGGRNGNLTGREGILWDALLAGKSLSDAAREAGYSEECLGRTRWRALQGIKATMPEILARHGLTLDAFARKLKELVCAKETRFFGHKGRVIATRRVPAYRIQTRGLDMWARILGLYDHPEPVQSAPRAIRVIYERPLGALESPALPAESSRVTSGATPPARRLLTGKNE
jgi:hypothetical protein